MLANSPSSYIASIRHALAHAVEDTSAVKDTSDGVDITAAQCAEEQHNKTQAELAHVMRMTTLGELTASIAHEVNEPLTGVVANAEACLLWLDRGTPNLDEARHSLDWIIKDGNRAVELMRRVCALSKKATTQKSPLDINNMIEE
jgi:C4-dicarboxylate-specific signal transduction histidine kinase